MLSPFSTAKFNQEKIFRHVFWLNYFFYLKILDILQFCYSKLKCRTLSLKFNIQMYLNLKMIVSFRQARAFSSNFGKRPLAKIWKKMIYFKHQNWEKVTT